MKPDWEAIRAETLATLKTLIRFDTTNPPGNELPLAVHIERVLREEGIETSLLNAGKERAQVIGRIRGSGARRPVILLAHMDVVGVERASWTHDPFGAEVDGGYLYGRGAIDDKGMLAVNLVTMLHLQRLLSATGGKLSRDVVFVATSDEEAGGEWGMGWLVRHHPEILDAEFAINEGGRTRIIEGGRTYLAVQAAEKVSHVVTVTAHGSAGHAAVPLPDNSIFRLASALDQLSRHLEPVMLTEITRQFFARLAEIWPDREEKNAMLDLVAGDDGQSQAGARILARRAVFNAVLRNGISPSVVQGGRQFNVIPDTATAVLNVRTLPGESLDKVVARMRAAVTQPGVTIDITERGQESPWSDPGSEMFAAITAAAHELDPKMPVVPYLSTGVTDSARLRRLGVQAYGILPFPMAQADEERMHGADERIPLDALHFGSRLVFGAISRIAR
ncbi:MAG TPA: M20/M25/M40 family metallo-hydrolase [Gemmatimonadaceae bacterium]|nr:M20/M25/M40 family metallo-hydrolase [Gemmatimonadaceae bacterium]